VKVGYIGKWFCIFEFNTTAMLIKK